MSSSIHFRTVTNALARIIVSIDLIFSDLSLPIIRNARSFRALDLLINICALLRCKIRKNWYNHQLVEHGTSICMVMYGVNLQSSPNLLLAFFIAVFGCEFRFRLGSMIQPRCEILPLCCKINSLITKADFNIHSVLPF